MQRRRPLPSHQAGLRHALARALALVLMALALMTMVVPVQAQGADRSEALKLAGEAIDLFDAGDFEAALEKFSKADGLVDAVTLKLRVARCLDKLNRMQEAASKYREVIAYQLPKKAPSTHREARKQAVPELAALREQIPSLTVVVNGEGASYATVTLAGEPWPSEMLGQKQEMDPGNYVFEASRGERSVRELVSLERGQSLRVELLLPDEEAPPADVPAEGDDGDTMRALGYGFLGLGGAGAIMAVVAGVLVLKEEDDLLARCPNRTCPADASDDVEAFDSARIATTVGMVLGGVGIAAGVTLLLLAPSDADADEGEQPAARVQPFFGPTGAGLWGTF